MILPSLVTPPAVVPRPVTVQMRSGSFALDKDTAIVAPKALNRLAKQLQSNLSATGLDLPIKERAGDDSLRLRLDPKLERLGPEGYQLDASSRGVEIRASAPAGVFYGIQTLRQLLPTDVFRRAPVAGETYAIPAVHIEDRPRFSWRGAHLDVGRHFMPKEFLLKYVDLISLHKLNVLHLHLTDDQGWRIEIKKYPKLTTVGAWRKESMLGHYRDQKFDGVPHGGFYTQDDLRELVAYARERFVTVVPEIEMPGHSQAAIAAYPELGNLSTPLEVGTRWGVIENVFNVEDSTIGFLEDVLDETMAIFPSTFIHVGGDEVPKTQWKASEKAQAKIKALGLKDEHELQSWFIHQIDTYLTAKGRRLIGWDEILEGGLAPGATVMSWRGEEGGIAAAKAGHDVVMTPGAWTYFDHYQAQDQSKEPLAIGGFLPLSKAYEYDPVPSSLTAEEARHVLGAQGQIWTEYIGDPKKVEYMAFPRFCALSEVVWSPREGKSYDDFIARLKTHLDRLKALDVNYRPPEEIARQ